MSGVLLDNGFKRSWIAKCLAYRCLKIANNPRKKDCAFFQFNKRKTKNVYDCEIKINKHMILRN